jgi:hypothetical protein
VGDAADGGRIGGGGGDQEVVMSATPPVSRKKTICKVCEHEILPPGKNFCNDCKSFQDWRWPLTGAQIPLTLLTALISVITSAITAGSWACYHQSHTSATVMSDATAGISVYVWNTGRNPSAVLTCTLRYMGSKNEDIPIADLKPEILLIPAAGHSIIPITPVPMPHDRAVKAAALLLTVQESNGCKKDLPALPLSDKFIIQLHQ